MPRKQPLPQREASICERLVVFRESRGLSRAALARAAGINRFSFANIERKQAPLGFACGYNLCNLYNVSLRWLATGEKPVSPFTPLSRNILDRIEGNETFAKAHDACFGDLVKKGLEELAVEQGRPVDQLDRGQLIFSRRRLGVSRAQSKFEMVSEFLAERAAVLSEDERISFASELETIGFKYLSKAGKSSKPMVDTSKPGAIVGGVSSEIPTWKQLVKELKRLTSEPGAKAQLAVDLKTTRQNVNKWLSGAGAPATELTLDVLRWVRKHQAGK